MAKLKDKVIWITGASSGIGEALVYEFIKHDTKLILTARRQGELERVKNNCPDDKKENIKILSADLSFTDTLNLTVQNALAFFGRVDILVNNAGISQRSLIKDTLLEVDRKIMEINYFASVALSKLLLPSMIEQGGGHIVNISSLVGKFSTPLRSAYSASKHALHGFFEAMRAELWKENIKISMICPGFVRTNVSINALTEDGNPLNRMSKEIDNGIPPEKCAKHILKAIRKQKAEVYIGGKEKYAVYIHRFFPGLFRRIIKNMGAKKSTKKNA